MSGGRGICCSAGGGPGWSVAGALLAHAMMHGLCRGRAAGQITAQRRVCAGDPVDGKSPVANVCWTQRKTLMTPHSLPARFRSPAATRWRRSYFRLAALRSFRQRGVGVGSDPQTRASGRGSLDRTLATRANSGATALTEVRCGDKPPTGTGVDSDHQANPAFDRDHRTRGRRFGNVVPGTRYCQRARLD